MHHAPGRGIWCLGQSNTNTGHDIPSGPLDAHEHCHRGPEPAAQAAGFDSEEATAARLDGAGYGLTCGGGATPVSSAPWGLTRLAIPASLTLNLGQRNSVAVGSDLISARSYRNQELLTRVCLVTLTCPIRSGPVLADPARANQPPGRSWPPRPVPAARLSPLPVDRPARPRLGTAAQDRFPRNPARPRPEV
jgi:hypothetical protein